MSTRPAKQRFFIACAIGGVAALVIFAWFALEGRPGLFQHGALSNFYEIQARSWLHGHWDADAGAYLFERFKVDGRYYTYFGPWPALLRLPFVLFTDSLDGDLSRVSMIMAFGVLVTYAARISWLARTVLRGEGEPTRAALLATGAFVFVAGCGSTALFLGSATWVYHEAILWGVAWALASFFYIASMIVTPSRRALVLACVTATFAYLSRGSVGLGPVAALGIVFVLRLAVGIRARWRARGAGDAADPDTTAAPWWLRWAGLGSVAENRAVGPIALATAIPVALYAAVNYVKFKTLFGTPPYQLQDLLATRPSRQAALAANGGSLFGFKFAPTLLLDYLRPDGIGFDRLFPWVTFAGPPRNIGGVTFEALNFSSSVPATSTLLFLLTIVGVIAALRRARARSDGPSAAAFRIPILGALAGCAGTFVLAFLEERYLGDFVPLLVLAGAVGLWWIPTLVASRKALRIVSMTALVVLAAWSCWATFGLTLLQQRAFGPLVSTQTRGRFIDFQLGVHDAVPGGLPSRVEHGQLPLPDVAEAQTLLIVGKCAGLYWSNGRFWHPVEETPTTGRFNIRLRLDASPAGEREPLLFSTDDRGSSIIWIHHLGPNRVRFEYEWTGKNQGLIEGVTPDATVIGQRTSAAITVRPGQQILVRARLDPAGYVGVRVRGKQLMSTFAPVANTPAVIGHQDVSNRGATTLAASTHVLATPTPICDELEREARDEHARTP